MSTPTGTISANNVENTLNEGLSTNYPGGTSKLTFNDSLVRTLASKPSGAISMNDMRGKAGPGAYGSLASQSCSGYTLTQVFNDGRYGTYSTTTLKSSTCGWNPPAYGTYISQVCNGSTLTVTYADGNYGTYTVDTPNSNQCVLAVLSGTVSNGTNIATASYGVSMTTPQRVIDLSGTTVIHGPISNIPLMILSNGVQAYFDGLVYVPKTKLTSLQFNVSSAIDQGTSGWSTATIECNGVTTTLVPGGTYTTGLGFNNITSAQYHGPLGNRFTNWIYKGGSILTNGSTVTITIK
jgi:hypothetical protein